MDLERRYQLLERIGGGTHDEVYRAEVAARGHRRVVAVRLLDDHAARLGYARVRVRDDAIRLERLAHPSIVGVVDFVQLVRGWAVVTEWMEGVELAHVLSHLQRRGRRLSAPAAAELATQIASALAAAHGVPDGVGAAGIVHGHLQPCKVRITADGQVGVMDFGVSADPDAGQGYLSPERLRGRPPSPTGDVYALGALIAELFLGRPIGLPVARHERFVSAIAHDVRAALGTQPIRVHNALAGVITACLGADPSSRPDAAAVERCLDPLAGELEGSDLAGFCSALVPTVLADRSPHCGGAARIDPTVSDPRGAGATLVPIPSSPPGRRPAIATARAVRWVPSQSPPAPRTATALDHASAPRVRSILPTWGDEPEGAEQPGDGVGPWAATILIVAGAMSVGAVLGLLPVFLLGSLIGWPGAAHPPVVPATDESPIAAEASEPPAIAPDSRRLQASGGR